MVETQKSYSTFSVANFYFGIRTTDVTELTRDNEVTPVPLAPPAIRGLINLRGQIVTAINIRERLGIGGSDYAERPIALFYSLSGNLFGLLVDAVNDILEVQESSFEPPPGHLPELAQEFITGVYKLEDRLLFVLDPRKIVTGIADVHR
jgi:purine-binding chemotaxis protein CheW